MEHYQKETPVGRRLSDYQVNENILDPVARAVSWFGRIYNDYEVEGLENIPTEGPALVVFYHGLVLLIFGTAVFFTIWKLVARLEPWVMTSCSKFLDLVHWFPRLGAYPEIQNWLLNC